MILIILELDVLIYVHLFLYNEMVVLNNFYCFFSCPFYELVIFFSQILLKLVFLLFSILIICITLFNLQGDWRLHERSISFCRKKWKYILALIGLSSLKLLILPLLDQSLTGLLIISHCRYDGKINGTSVGMLILSLLIHDSICDSIHPLL